MFVKKIDNTENIQLVYYQSIPDKNNQSILQHK